MLAFTLLLATAAALPGPRPSGEILLPNGRTLTPAGLQAVVAPYPFALAPTPDGRRLVVASMGPDDRVLQLLDARTGTILSSAPLRAAWIGLALSRDGRSVWVSGANRNALLAFSLRDDRLVPEGEVPTTAPGETGASALPGGLALSVDGEALFVARTEADDVVRVDLASRSVSGRFAVGRKPYRPVLSPDGKLLAVSLWGAAAVALLDAGTGETMARVATLDHPCDLVFSPDGARLYVAQANRNVVAVVDVGAKRVVRQVSVAMGPEGPGSASAEAMPDGSTPSRDLLGRDVRGEGRRSSRQHLSLLPRVRRRHPRRGARRPLAEGVPEAGPHGDRPEPDDPAARERPHRGDEARREDAARHGRGQRPGARTARRGDLGL